jgi:hypothetical protein
MRHIALCFLLTAVLLAGQSQEKKESPKTQGTKPATSLTGCVDQQEGHYVLLDASTRDAIANLLPDGFEEEAFAKHLGHKVTVRGTSQAGAGRLVFKVRAVEPISETCEPQR